MLRAPSPPTPVGLENEPPVRNAGPVRRDDAELIAELRPVVQPNIRRQGETHHPKATPDRSCAKAEFALPRNDHATVPLFKRTAAGEGRPHGVEPTYD